jgi:hypothetical protein
MSLALVGWVTGCAAIWSALFMIGNLLYGRYDLALPLGAVFVVSGSGLIVTVNKLWADGPKAG